jgi:transposase
VTVEIVQRAEGVRDFAVQARPWVAERPIAWINRCRCLANDLKEREEIAETRIYLATTHLMVRRLCVLPDLRDTR